MYGMTASAPWSDALGTIRLAQKRTYEYRGGVQVSGVFMGCCAWLLN